MRAAIKVRGAPLNGTLLWAPTQGGQDVTQLGINLDEIEPVARAVTHGTFGDASFGAPYFDTKQTKTLDHGEQEVFLIEARTMKNYVEWCLDMDLLVGLQQRTVQACPKGQNIRTTAVRFTPSAAGGPGKFQDYKILYDFDFMTSEFRSADPKIY
jgi:hypothetical protein